jgi:hypothetical protein
MKKLLILILLVAVIMCGCTSKKVNENDYVTPTPIVSAQPIITPGSSNTPNITFDDQREVQELIKSYFEALEKGDYETAWKCTSEQIRQESDSNYIKRDYRFKTIRLVSMKGYIPPSEKNNYTTLDVPEGTPTVDFVVKLDVKAGDSAYDDGQNTRFVYVVKDSDGKWRIHHLATCP